jgi:hypothetical protein
MTKWLVEIWDDKPQKVEVVKQTEKTVTLRKSHPYDGKPYDRKMVNPDIFDTFDQAKAFMVQKQEDRLKSLRLQLDRENGKLGQLKGLKNPDEKEGIS